MRQIFTSNKQNFKFILLFGSIFLTLELIGGSAGMYFDLWGEWFPSFLLGVGGIAPIAFAISLIIAKRQIRANWRITIGIALLFGTFAIFGFDLALYPPEGIFALYPEIDTRFAAGYSPQKLDQIHVGMNTEEVLSILGTPLNKQIVLPQYSQKEDTVWWYSGDGGCTWYDFAWKAVIVMFKKGKVVRKGTLWCYD